ncbi:unnamed protein product [Larinioides sclopetarius]|uniref:Uncharacterized protein n=1 Tax=Larinioides sclopetarius TaxID=280406 RepID=A0AAV2AWH3_9ARAC
MLTYKEIYPVFKYVNSSYYEFHTDDIDTAAVGFCHLKGKEQEYSYVQTVKGIIDYTNNILCTSSDKQDLCKKYTSLLNCFFNLLDNLMEQNVCTLDK